MRRTIKATKREMVINVLRALYLVRDIDENNPLWIKRINKEMKNTKAGLIRRNELAIKIVSDKLL